MLPPGKTDAKSLSQMNKPMQEANDRAPVYSDSSSKLTRRPLIHINILPGCYDIFDILDHGKNISEVEVNQREPDTNNLSPN